MGDSVHGQGRYTHIKQEHYRALVSALLEIFPHMQRRNDWIDPVFHEIEMNAGSGRAIDGSAGSPLIFVEEAERRNVQYRQFCMELDCDRCLDLFLALGGSSAESGESTIIPGDHNDTISNVMERVGPLRLRAIGLLYADPNNAEPPMHAIQRFYRDPRFRYMDCAINVPATTYKRVRRAFIDKYPAEGKPLPWLSRDIDLIPKKHKLIREPIGNDQWTMIVGTNWADFPVMKKYGFHRLESTEGQDIFRRVNWAKEEEHDGTTSRAS